MTVGQLSADQFARALAGQGLRLRVGPFVIHLRSSLLDLAHALHLLYHDFPIDQCDDIADFHVQVRAAGGVRRVWHPQAQFIFDGHQPFLPLPRRFALPLYEWGLNYCVAATSHQYLVIHAGVLERDGRAVILPGPPGSGKSTLTAAMALRGWRLLSDELALIEPATGLIWPVPRPVGLKDASIDIIRRLEPTAVIGPASPDTVKGTVAHLRPPRDAVQRMHEPARPGWIVFPRYQAGAAPLTEPLPRPHALLKLAENSFNYSALGRTGFETLANLIEPCECHAIQYGSLQDALNLMDHLATTAGAPANSAPAIGEPASAGVSAPPHKPTPARNLERSKLNHATHTDPLLALLLNPAIAPSLSLTDWDTLIPRARASRLLGRLAHLVDHSPLPPRVRTALQAARNVAQQHHRAVRWEVGRIRRALATLDAPVVLLKGAAYVMADLPAARGRLLNDVDILVPAAALQRAERLLLDAGWQHMKLHPYDQRYYRDWMHELPPLKHAQRRTVLDVHHSILPLTGRLRVDGGTLLSAAVPLDGDAQLFTLSAADMVLHAAAHMFQDGELDGSLRDLLDIDDLLRRFAGRDVTFYDRLLTRGKELGLCRPLAYALRYTQRLLHAPQPALGGLDLPPTPVLAMMDRLVLSSVVPQLLDQTPRRVQLARLALYTRSHWLRMPPVLLAKHLWAKATRGIGEQQEEEVDAENAENR